MIKISKISNKKHAFIFLLVCVIFVFAFLPALSSCNTEKNGNETEIKNESNQNDENSDKNENNSDDSAQDEKDGYNFPDVKYSGEKFIILNNEPIWDFTTIMVPEEQTGDALNDAMWARNMAINEQFNIQLVEMTRDINDIPKQVRLAVQSQSQDFDAVFCPGSTETHTVGSLVVEGSLADLTAINELNLNSEWWNQKALEDAKIGGNSAVYFASNDISIHALQCPWVIYFNEDMLRNLGLNKPYQLVRDGKWTLGQMQMYMKAAANINSDESFKPYKASGTAIYGLSTAVPAIGELFRGSDVSYVGRDSNNMPVFTANEPRFINAAQKLGEILTGDGMHTDGGSTHYELVFINGRSLFCYAEFKAGTVYRDSETTFGIVPTPKFDENQESYVNNMTQQAPVFIIPISTPDITKTATVIDALAYLSHRDVTQVFFNINMSQKELRNEESVEMLQIILDTSIFDIGRIYNWSNAINKDTYNDIAKGGGNIASIIEKHADKINAAIEKTISELQK